MKWDKLQEPVHHKHSRQDAYPSAGPTFRSRRFTFAAGLFLETLTKLAPAAGNVLSIALNGSTADSIVPADATLASIAAHMDDHDLFDLLAASRAVL